MRHAHLCQTRFSFFSFSKGENANLKPLKQIFSSYIHLLHGLWVQNAVSLQLKNQTDTPSFRLTIDVDKSSDLILVVGEAADLSH